MPLPPPVTLETLVYPQTTSSLLEKVHSDQNPTSP